MLIYLYVSLKMCHCSICLICGLLLCYVWHAAWWWQLTSTARCHSVS